MPQITFPKALVCIAVLFFVYSPSWGTVIFFGITCALYVFEQMQLESVHVNVLNATMHKVLEIRDEQEKIRLAVSNYSATLKDVMSRMEDVNKLADDTKQMLTQSKISAAMKRQ